MRSRAKLFNGVIVVGRWRRQKGCGRSHRDLLVWNHLLWGAAVPALIVLLPITGGEAIAADARVTIVVSTSSQTLRVHRPGQRSLLFPVAVSRQQEPPTLRWLGPDPADTRYYQPSRSKPALHGGHPFLRFAGASVTLGIHGPVTPSLIWGAVTAGCLRMRSADIRQLYGVARSSPGIRVRFTSAVEAAAGQLHQQRCGRHDTHPTMAPRARRLRQLRLGRNVRGSACDGVDHWFAVNLQGGDRLTVRLKHRGDLRLELYGIRAISRISRGRFSLNFVVPVARHNRGDRYLRVVAPEQSVTGQARVVHRRSVVTAYVLHASLL